jgi:hypothetical protein
MNVGVRMALLFGLALFHLAGKLRQEKSFALSAWFYFMSFFSLMIFLFG